MTVAGSKFRQVRNDLLYRGLILAAAAGRQIPLSAARAIGRGLGLVASLLLRRERQRAIESLAVAYPEMSDAERAGLARAMFVHLGTSLLEIAWMPNLDPGSLAATTSFEGLEHLQKAADAGKGVVLFTGHCGNWEWMAAAIGLSGFSMNVIAREIYDSRLNDFIVASRARHGVSTSGRGSGGSAREMLQTLRSGGILGVLIDQSIRAESVKVPFFGRSAPTPVGPARLAIRSGAAAIAGFIERRGATQHIRFEPPIFPSRGDDPEALTASMTAAIEQQVRQAPAQWAWMHRRWRGLAN